MSFDMMLLAAQASGLAANLWQTKRQNRYDLLGVQMQQKQLDLKMQQDSLVSSQESLINIEKLRENMSSQRAMVAARGQLMQGSNFFVSQKSLNNYNMDEQARKMSLGFQKYNNKATQSLMMLDYLGKKKGTHINNMMQNLNTISPNSINSLLQGTENKSNSEL